jgi:Flp pilus assembly protein TadD
MRRFLASAAALVILTGCATDGVRAPRLGAETSPKAATKSRGKDRARAKEDATSAYGMYLAGEAALNDGRTQEATRYFEAARASDPPEPSVDEKAFTAALLAGDVPRAAALAPTNPDSSEPIRRMGALVRAVELMADNKGKDAYGLLTSPDIGFPHKPAASLLAPWAAAQAGNTEASLVRPQVRGDRIVDYFGALGQALLFERAGRFDEAETNFKAATSGPTQSELAILNYGAFLERRGRRLDAVALYQAALDVMPDATLTAAKNRAATGGKAPPAPSLREGAAQALLAPVATMVSAKQAQIALAYLRLLLRLDPARGDAWMTVGDLMQSNGDAVAARAAYSHVPPGSSDYLSAQGKLAWSYAQADDQATAEKIARTAAASGDPDARLTLADLLRGADKCAEASAILGDLIRTAPKPDWRLHFGRAVCLEKLGRWPEAESDLQAALKLRPDEPELLNYLGYSWIDRGVRLKEALGMVEKAVGQNPRSGAMVDSLGWAYYKLGDYKQAVEKLEAAVELEAGDPDINDHLGDAYWRVGRRDEARFQWRRVLTLKPDDKQRAAAEAKLASPLGPDGAPSQKVAGQ